MPAAATAKTVKTAKGKTVKPKKVPPVKYTIDCSTPAGDNIFDTAAFEKYLKDRVKVGGRTGNLGSTVAISRNGAIITITAPTGLFAKRYFKYLTKKFLKKNQIRDWLRVIANSKFSFELRYPQINSNEEEEDGDE
ncbi:ribosomal L22e protein family-domain-containing protein [Zopfochytrium polystomum]|nr:ribosomal L22e protein family-domain-containing protein [Zopfochytrium polystomum]